MQMTVLSDKIMKQVRGHGKGSWVFFAKDFLALGNRPAVDQALSRLCKRGTLRRVGCGLYDWPRLSQVLGRPAPVDLNVAVAAIARRDGLRVMPDGMMAAHRLGLTNAVPSKAVYLTDGSSRSIKIGNHTVRLKHVNPSLIGWARRSAAPVVSALLWLGPPLVRDADMINQLGQRLPMDVKRDLANGLSQLPTWAIPIARKLANNQGLAA